MEPHMLVRGDRRPIRPRPRYTIRPASRHRIARSEVGHRQRTSGSITLILERILAIETETPLADDGDRSDPEADPEVDPRLLMRG